MRSIKYLPIRTYYCFVIRDNGFMIRKMKLCLATQDKRNLRRPKGRYEQCYFGFPWLCFLVLLHNENLTLQKLSFIQITVFLYEISLSRIAAFKICFVKATIPLIRSSERICSSEERKYDTKYSSE